MLLTVDGEVVRLFCETIDAINKCKKSDADLSEPEEEREVDDRVEAAAIVAEDKGAYLADREGRTR